MTWWRSAVRVSYIPMPLTLPHLRSYTAHLFALALREILPQAILQGGRIDEIGFYYSFHFSKPIPKEIISMIEEKMRGWVKSPPPFRVQEMVPKNAASLFRDLGEEELAETCLESHEDLVRVVSLGDYWDLAIGEPKRADHFAFALLELNGENDVWEVFGSAFVVKDELKAFVKKYKLALKNDWQKRGVEEKYLVVAHHQPLWLPNGVQLQKKFYDLFLATLPENALEVMTPPSWHGTKEESYQLLYQACPGSSIWEWNSKGDYLTSFLLPQEEELFMKSSLQFFDKTLKILGFEAYERKKRPGPLIETCLYDSLGRSFEGPRLEISRVHLPGNPFKGRFRATRTLFPDLETIMLKWIELDTR